MTLATETQEVLSRQDVKSRWVDVSVQITGHFQSKARICYAKSTRGEQRSIRGAAGALRNLYTTDQLADLAWSRCKRDNIMGALEAGGLVTLTNEQRKSAIYMALLDFE